MTYKLDGVQMSASNSFQMDTEDAYAWLTSPKRNPV